MLSNKFLTDKIRYDQITEKIPLKSPGDVVLISSDELHYLFKTSYNKTKRNWRLLSYSIFRPETHGENFLVIQER